MVEGVAGGTNVRGIYLSKECPFQVNNIKIGSADDIFLVMSKAGTCEIINVSNDTLNLSGFNVFSNSDYHIIYKKMK